MEKKNVSLTKRENQVLNALVRAHVDSGLPVGSVTLSEEYDLGVSSATIRATLASLEEKGCLQQPHSSCPCLAVPKNRSHHRASLWSLLLRSLHRL